MKWKVIVTAVLAGLAGIPVSACIDPMSEYSAGIVFSAGEIISTQNIENYSRDSLSYIKTCNLIDATEGQNFILGTAEGKPADQVSIDSAWVVRNTLYLTVRYGGGCRVHSFALYTNGETTVNIPGSIDLQLSHDAHGDNCEALVHETLKFNLQGLCECAGIELHLIAPGVPAAYSPAPFWTPVSGVKTNFCSYKMRSAYADKVMAYIGEYQGLFNDESHAYKQLLVIFDSTQGVPTAEDKTAAIMAELERLSVMQVVTMTENRLRSIEAHLLAHPAQYWTNMDTVLDFNQWINGEAVDAVRGVYTAKGCGSGISYELPVKPVTTGITQAGTNLVHPLGRNISAVIRNRQIELTFTPVSGNASQLRMTDMNGRQVAVLPLGPNAGQATITTSWTVPGCYVISIIDNGHILQTGRISVTGY